MMVETTTNDYALAATELPSVHAWVNFQNAFGVGRKQVSATDIPGYLSKLDELSGAYYNLQNPKLRGLLDQFFSFMSATDEVAQMYLVCQYYLFCRDNNIQPPPPDAITDGEWGQPWISYWDVFAVSSIYEWRTPPNGSNKHGMWQSNLQLPGSPHAWNLMIYNLVQKWAPNPPAGVIDPGVKMDAHAATAAFEYSILQKWTGFQQVAASTAPVWKAQRDLVSAMLKEPSLSPDAYLLLLHLLIALGTSNVNDQQLAQKVAAAPVNSIESANDTLSNQIVYLTLMYFADPRGAYGYTNAKLQGLLNDINQLVVGTDQASGAIRLSLANYLKILISDSAYPVQDLDNPGIGFNTRLTDTLAALDITRSGLVSV